MFNATKASGDEDTNSEDARGSGRIGIAPNSSTTAAARKGQGKGQEGNAAAAARRERDERQVFREMSCFTACSTACT